MPEILKIIAALLNIGFGIYSLLQPEPVAKASGFTLNGPRGRAELRIAFGGYFIGMGLAALLISENAAYQAVGAGWLTAGIVRGITLFMEDRTALLNPSWFILWAFEIGVGLILIL